MHPRVTQLLSVGRYPEYFVDVFLGRIMLLGWRLSGQFKIGARPILRGLPIISLSQGSSIEVGDDTYLISRSRNTALGVNHPVILRTLGRTATIRIGHFFRASGVTLCAAKSIVIGDRVMFGANVAIVDTDFHASDPPVRASPGDAANAKNAPVTIGDDVFVGMNAMILKGVTIGNAARVGAGSVVTRDVPAGAVVAGNPARLISPPAPSQS